MASIGNVIGGTRLNLNGGTGLGALQNAVNNHSTNKNSTNNSTNNSSTTTNIPEYISLGTTSTNDYSSALTSNYSIASQNDFSYGWLVDLTNGGSFKFYIPEFSESAGANWGDIDIPGRSVSIKYYNNTSSRTIVINLDLYAGVGYYNIAYMNPVTKLHNDANFIKSLEYPDYSGTVVAPPPTVQLILGRSVNLTGVISNVSVEHLKPLDSQNRSMYLRVSFTFTQNTPNPPGYKDIRSGSYTIST